MSLNAYLTLKGQKQGPIHGSVTEKGREETILVHAFTNEIDSLRDAASGLPTGKRLHKPLLILKEIDRSSPLLWTALVTNENLDVWQLDVWRTAGMASIPHHIYTIKLTNASIASIRDSMDDNEDPLLASRPLRTEIAFTYQRIEWIWVEGETSSQDDWQSSQA